MKPKVKIYYDLVGTYEYVCDAELGTALTATGRKVRRITKDGTGRTTDLQVALPGGYENIATDITAVAALVYT